MNAQNACVKSYFFIQNRVLVGWKIKLLLSQLEKDKKNPNKS
jgi:hypothetical protein